MFDIHKTLVQKHISSFGSRIWNKISKAWKCMRKWIQTNSLMLVEAICNVFNSCGQPTFMDMNLEFLYQKLNSSIEWVYKRLVEPTYLTFKTLFEAKNIYQLGDSDFSVWVKLIIKLFNQWKDEL